MSGNGQDRWQKRFERERLARKEAERLLEQKSLELYEANHDLQGLADAIAAKERRIRGVFEAIAECVLIVDPEHRIESANRSIETIFGYSQYEIAGKPVEILFSRHPELGEECLFRTQLRQAIQDQLGILQEINGFRKDGSEVPLEVGISSVQVAESFLTILTVQDATAKRQAQESIRRLAYYDTLTGLPNRALFQDRVEQSIQRCRRDDSLMALLLIDLDRFTRINDSLGRGVGDRLLRELGQRLQKSLRAYDAISHLEGVEYPSLVSRVGSDEFALLISQLKSIGDLETVGQRLLKQARQPFHFEGREVVITASIGVAIYPDDGEVMETMLISAENAMFHCKEHGGDGMDYYAASMHRSTIERLELENDLRHALNRGEFEVHYQPQFNVETGLVVGAEALVRWNHPQRGLVSPWEFLPLAEEIGLIGPISEWVLGEAVQRLVDWQQQGLKPISISVNVSNQQFNNPELISRVSAELVSSGLAPGQLELELTETIVMDNPANAAYTLKALKDMGVRLAIDDFGTGYSSLAYLKGFPIDKLKIDRSFVKDLPDDPDACAIVRVILGLAKLLEMEVIAEGVETREQQQFLREHGCRLTQGYLFSPPVPEADFISLLEDTSQMPKP